MHHRGTYGNAVLTRWPVKAVRRVEIGVIGREPRAVLDTDIEVAGLRGPRHRHALRLAGFGAPASGRDARGMLGPDDEGCTILLGDFNEWAPMGHTLRR